MTMEAYANLIWDWIDTAGTVFAVLWGIGCVGWLVFDQARIWSGATFRAFERWRFGKDEALVRSLERGRLANAHLIADFNGFGVDPSVLRRRMQAEIANARAARAERARSLRQETPSGSRA